MKKMFSMALLLGLGFGSIANAQEVASQPPVAEALVAPAAESVKLFQQQWLHADADGNVNGKVTTLFRGGRSEAVPGLPIVLTHHGRVVASATTDQNGAFSLGKVAPGCYAIETVGSAGTFVYALNVLPGSAPEGEKGLNSFAITPGGSLISKYFARHMTPYTGTHIDHLYKDADALPSSSIGQVKLDANGIFRGRLLPSCIHERTEDLSDMHVYVVQNGQEIASTKAKADGSFSFGGLTSGIFGLVAAGPKGRAAVGFELVENNAVAKASRPLPKLVSFQDAAVQPAAEAAVESLNLQLAAPFAEEVAEEDLGEFAAMPAGYAPGAGAGGGGAGGGFGGLLGLAGLGGAIVALSNQGDNGPASPVGP
ncbi:MAG: hypothetical protein RLY14_1201 [Planctomycetota bacterium]